MRCLASFLLIVCLTFFVSSPVQSKDDFGIAGLTDCGSWIEARKQELARLMEVGVSAYLSGRQYQKHLMNFWFSKKGRLTQEQVWLWIDKYCRDNPLKGVSKGADELFSSHATVHEQ